ncbi:MAG: tRNA (adenosine(37)-N6)-dimethylallyltransferase MiaA [Acetobacteraceae bacterium]
MTQEAPPALILAGPTASGKSTLALALAERLGGVIINADAMQCYRDLRLLTARPSPDDEAAQPHRLYGVRGAAETVNAAWWREAALAEMAAAHAAGRLPILCGGSGLYLAVLCQGIVAIPQIAPEVRAEARALLARLGAAGLHARLSAADPATAARLRPSDAQRLTRAWEVWRATRRGLAQWQEQPAQPAPWRFRALLIEPPREGLRAAIAARFAAMLAAGAVEEVRALLGRGLDPALPLMRAHGVPELAAHLHGEITLAEAAARAIAAQSRYIKRQATWFRHHTLAAPEATHRIYARIAGPGQFSVVELENLVRFVRAPG